MNLALGIEEKYHPPTEEEVSKYSNEEYPEWLGKVKAFFAKLHENLEYPERCIRLSFAISNSGSVPAENILIRSKRLEVFSFYLQPLVTTTKIK